MNEAQIAPSWVKILGIDHVSDSKKPWNLHLLSCILYLL